jgi:hypoxanthine-guanine phosphoribosyltransferase
VYFTFIWVFMDTVTKKVVGVLCVFVHFLGGCAFAKAENHNSAALYIATFILKTRGLQSRPEDRLCRPKCENKFVVYGMDYNNLERNLPELYVQTNPMKISCYSVLQGGKEHKQNV